MILLVLVQIEMELTKRTYCDYCLTVQSTDIIPSTTRPNCRVSKSKHRGLTTKLGSGDRAMPGFGSWCLLRCPMLYGRTTFSNLAGLLDYSTGRYNDESDGGVSRTSYSICYRRYDDGRGFSLRMTAEEGGCTNTRRHGTRS